MAESFLRPGYYTLDPTKERLKKIPLHVISKPTAGTIKRAFIESLARPSDLCVQLSLVSRPGLIDSEYVERCLEEEVVPFSFQRIVFVDENGLCNAWTKSIEYIIPTADKRIHDLTRALIQARKGELREPNHLTLLSNGGQCLSWEEIERFLEQGYTISSANIRSKQTRREISIDSARIAFFRFQ